MTEFLLCLYEFFIPRFVEEWEALEESGDELVPVCSADDLGEDEYFPYFAKFKSFTWLNIAFPFSAGEPVTYQQFEGMQ